jgi:mono/diheme cytochrome c family protein
VTRGRGRSLTGLGLLLGLVLLLALAALWRELSAPVEDTPPPGPAAAGQLAHGAYLARIGNCQGCHTRSGGAPYAGGRRIATPFGDVLASNLTPDPVHGIGRWSDEAFWRALHRGISRDGRLLYPAFPYPHTTHTSRADSDAIHAYLRSLAPVAEPNPPHALRFPANQAWALAAWRLLFFEPGHTPLPAGTLPVADAERDAATLLARGAYLVQGLAHCGACHAERNRFGAAIDRLRLDGAVMPGEPWYAPSLHRAGEAGVADWPLDEVVALLRTGVSARSSVQGPMAEVVHGSTQYLSPGDARAMAWYVQRLPQAQARPTPAPDPALPDVQALRRRGGQLYTEHCADCHGRQGEGVPGAYPALAGNRALRLDPAVNLVQVIAHGGFAPVTRGNPRPFGMPPYALQLDHADMAALISYLRSSWGHQAAAVSPLAVQRWREAGRR